MSLRCLDSDCLMASWRYEFLGTYGMSEDEYGTDKIQFVFFLLGTTGPALDAACHGPVSVCSDFCGLQNRLLGL